MLWLALRVENTVLYFLVGMFLSGLPLSLFLALFLIAIAAMVAELLYLWRTLSFNWSPSEDDARFAYFAETVIQALFLYLVAGYVLFAGR